MHNLTLNSVSTQLEYTMIVKYSTNVEISNLRIMNIDQLAFKIQNSSDIVLTHINISDSLRAISITENSNVVVNNSSFTNVGNGSIVYGGAIRSDDSNVSLNTTVFDH